LARRLDAYRRHDYPVPETMLAWNISGAGFDNVGEGGRPVRVPVPRPGRNECLLRVDAMGLCFSDVKLIAAGSDHVRIRGRDLKKNPTRGGHEVALTVAIAGEEEGFRVGDRFILQADVFYKGVGMAVGYVIPGGMAEYFLAPKEVLHGDDGCYLIPISDALGYADAALVEPWACIEAAYRIAARRAPAPDGRALVVDAGGGVPAGVPAGSEIVRAPDLAARAGELASGGGFDDVFVTGAGPDSAGLVAAALAVLGRGGALCLVAPGELPHEVGVDIGRVHYQGIRIVAGGTVEAAYAANVREDLLPGGAAHMSGAGGPMGQMHVQRAIEAERPPSAVVVTDLADDRLEYTAARLGPVAKERGVALACLNPRKYPSPGAAEGALLDFARMAGREGFDDIVVCAPVAALASAAVRQAAPGCVVNVFAGVGLGTVATLDLNAIARKSVRVVGSSGSRLEDMLGVVEKATAGRLSTGRSLGAVGGLAQTLDGLRGLKEGRFPGKTVIFPGIPDMPLIGMADLARDIPQVGRLLADGGAWTRRAEEALLEAKLAFPE